MSRSNVNPIVTFQRTPTCGDSGYTAADFKCVSFIHSCPAGRLSNLLTSTTLHYNCHAVNYGPIERKCISQIRFASILITQLLYMT